jgi:hypothetical protein
MTFAPMVQFDPLAHSETMAGTPAFLAAVVLSVVATRAFDRAWRGMRRRRGRNAALGGSKATHP